MLWSVICLMFLTLTNFSFAQGSQDFETQTVLTTQYADGSFTEDGITYNYVHCRNEGLGTNEDYSITGKGLILRRPNEPSSLEWTIPNGVGILTFDARKAFTGGNNNRQLEILVNGASVWTSPTFGIAGEDETIHNFSITIEEEGSTIIKIQLIGTNGNKQVTIDNISWTEYPASTPCIVNIPDANFKNYLINNLVINTNGDDEIQCDEASAFSGTINCSSLNISDLTGIEAFTNLTELRCQQNNLTTLNVSNNLNLTILRCYTNQLTSLDVSNNTNLTRLYCHDNQLNSLDVSENDLEYLWCYDNELTSLNVSGNTNLERLLCYNNQLTSLDVSTNANLDRFDCSLNQLTGLDVSDNSVLKRLWCNDNNLTYLKVKNGNNLNFITFEAQDNANLTCIEVDDPVYCTLNWTNIDSGTTFSQDCNPPCIVNIPDANFKTALLNNFPVIDTNGDGEIQCDEAENFTGGINCGGYNVSDLTGIEAFVNSTALYCNGNQLTNLDISNNLALTNLWCHGNQLTSLDVSNHLALTELYCHGNQLTSLDVSNNVGLTELYCNWNQFASLDVSNNVGLTVLRCHGNQLTSLDVSNNNALTKLLCQGNQLTFLSYPFVFCISI